MKYGIFTKPMHVEKLVSYLNMTDIKYVISTERKEIYAYEFDIGISYCWPWRIDVDWPQDINIHRIWYNYHPGILPRYPSIGSYAKAIRDKVTRFGVTLHRMTEEIDKGPVLVVKEFMLDSVPVNTNELGAITHYHLFQLFKETIKKLEKMPMWQEDMK